MAYTNFQNCTQEEYNEIIYSGDANHRLKLLFNGVEYPTANSKTESIKRIGKILSDGGERFSLDNFKAQTLELIIHDIDLEDIQEPISISIGTLVDDENDTYEYVPIGIFNLDETPTTSSDKTTIKVSDNASKFDFLYDASGVIERNGGEATMLQILQDICDKARVTLETTSFPNMNTKVSVWDNSINARQYVMYIGEKTGRIPNISRTGGLILIDLQSNETVEVESEDGIIEIDDALARTPEDLQLQGNTYQQTYTGKNLLNPVPDVSSINGVTVSYNSATQEITLNGTCTTNNSVVAFGESSSSSIYGNNTFQLLANTTLYLRIKYISGTSTGQYLLAAYNNNFGTGLQAITTGTGQDVTNSKSWPYDITFTRFRLRFENGTKFNNYKIKVYMSTTDNNYEPFVGRTASPNPDYPQSIQNVTGRQTIDVVGKNLWGGFEYINTGYTGITFTHNNNGTIIIDGTNNTGNTAYSMTTSNSTPYQKTLSAGTYTISGGLSNVILQIINSSGLLVAQTTSSAFNTTFTINQETKVYIRVQIANGVSFNNQTIYIMLEKGSTATTYEPYIGQSYEINLGKNLFDKDNANVVSAFVNGNNGLLQTPTNNQKSVAISVQPNTQYTISGVERSSSNYGLYDDATLTIGTSVATVKGLVSNGKLTFTTGANTKWFVFLVSAGTETYGYNNVQLEKGSQATTYSSYITPIELNKIGTYQDSIKKSTGKNLFDKSNANVINGNLADGGTLSSTNNARTLYIPCKNNTTYTITKAQAVYFRVAQFTNIPAIGDSYITRTKNDTANSITFTTTTGNYLAVTYWHNSSTNTEQQVLDSIMINEGSTALPYEPYLPIGTWYIEKKIGKIVLNGTENWTKRNNGDGTNTISFTHNMIYGAYGTNNEYCDRFNYEQSSTSGNEGIGANSTLDQYYIQIKRSRLSALNVDAFKTWLSTHNTEVYYVLSTPTITEITNADLINQLESIELLKGINNITVSSGNLVGGLKITYDKINDGIELDPLLFEKYTEGDLLEITRVVYEDAIRKFEYGDETGATLYINSANPYIVDASEIYNIYLQVRGLSLYSMKISKMIGNPALDPWDIIKFTYKNKEYRTLAQNTLTYNGVITQSFDTQIGTKEKSQENVTINSGDANFKRLYTRMDQAEGNIELNASQVSSVQSDLKENYFDKTSTEQLILNSANGLTNTFSEAGGNNIFRNTGLWFESGDSNNPYEFWTGIVVKDSNNLATNRNCLKLQSGTLFQEEQVPNGNYTISFKYKKLIPLANVKCVINDTEYTLSETTDTDFQQTITTSTNIKVQFISDTDNACEVYDLMVNAGEVKLAYSQNQNETTTDTVNISKGITITSSDDANTIFKANYDGIRIYEKNNMTTPKTEFTKKGTETNYLEVKDEAVVVDILIQRVGSQTWLTKI